jgi:hypothetical protein
MILPAARQGFSSGLRRARRYTVPEVYELYLGDNDAGEATDIARCYYVSLEALVECYGLKPLHESRQEQYERYEEGGGAAGYSAVNPASAGTGIKAVHFVTKRRNG